MYVERPAPVSGMTLWINSRDSDVRVLPDGCMDLMVTTDFRLLVAGPDTVAKIHPVGAPIVGLRFAPGTAPSVLGLPAHEIADRQPNLADLWPASRVRQLPDIEPTTAFVAELATHLAATAEQAEPWTWGLVDLLSAGSSVTAAARELGWSERQLRRKSLISFGYGPATLAGILRFRKAVNLAQNGEPLAAAARRAGYADQAHLARSARSLSGVSMSTLLRERSQSGNAA
jgi:AraC-like DNA-binding protein